MGGLFAVGTFDGVAEEEGVELLSPTGTVNCT